MDSASATTPQPGPVADTRRVPLRSLAARDAVGSGADPLRRVLPDVKRIPKAAFTSAI